MKLQEWREKTPGALQEELLNKLRELFNLRMQLATGQLTQTHTIRNTRRDVARVKTLLREKLGSQNPRCKSTKKARSQ